MISSVLRMVSMFAIAAVVISFAAFASDEAGNSSRQTVARLAAADTSYARGGVPRQVEVNLDEPNPGPSVERLRQREHGGVREFIDDANDQLTAPFKGVVSGDIWSRRIFQGLLALLVFGVGIGFAGRYASSRGV